MITDIPVRRIRRCSSGIANAGPNNPGQTPEPGVGSPESAQRKGRRLCMLWFLLVNARNSILNNPFINTTIHH